MHEFWSGYVEQKYGQKKKIMSYGHRQLYNLLKNKTFTWILLEVL